MADETRYEVGQVVVVAQRDEFDYFGLGSQVVFLGCEAENEEGWITIGRDGLSDPVKRNQIRPLKPGETPTIDSRGYPIEEDKEHAALIAACEAADAEPDDDDDDDSTHYVETDLTTSIAAVANSLLPGREVTITIRRAE